MITVTDRHEAAKRQHEFDFIISLVDFTVIVAESLKPSIKKGKVHIIEMDDILGKIHQLSIPPSREHVQGIIDIFAANNLKEKNVLVHCHAGISRSTATTIGLLIKFHDLTVSEAFDTVFTMRKQMWPNGLILQHFDDILGLHGELVKFDKQWKLENNTLIV